MDSPTSAYEKTQPLEACMSILVRHILLRFFGSLYSVFLSLSQCRRWEPKGPIWEHGQGLWGREQEEGGGGEIQETSQRESWEGAGQTKTGGLCLLHTHGCKSLDSNSHLYFFFCPAGREKQRGGTSTTCCGRGARVWHTTRNSTAHAGDQRIIGAWGEALAVSQVGSVSFKVCIQRAVLSLQDGLPLWFDDVHDDVWTWSSCHVTDSGSGLLV